MSRVSSAGVAIPAIEEAELVTVFTRQEQHATSPAAQRLQIHSSQPSTLKKRAGSHAPLHGDDADEPLTDHKIRQRQKQVQFGLNTKGYSNMLRLMECDPRLRNGGVLPLQPPQSNLRASKRAWDVLARKWRRALHLFDDVFIDGEDDAHTTLAAVVEEQRLKWVSPRNLHLPSEQRQRHSCEAIFAARNGNVRTTIPVEECMKAILRSPDCYEDMCSVVPDSASSLIKGNTGVSPTDAGIKMFIAPSAETSLFNTLGASETSLGARSPSPDMPVTPSTIAQMRTASPMYPAAQPSSRSSPDMRSPTNANVNLQATFGSWRSTSPPMAAPPVVPADTSIKKPSTLSPFAAPFQPTAAPIVTRDFSPLQMSSQQESPAMRLEQNFHQVDADDRRRLVGSAPSTTAEGNPAFAPPPPLASLPPATCK